ncbi:hypothetical protein PHLGIDRAFT_490114 [Phlebiopsis gigantea 11061_1 CR5-6]|uniref:Uncharacterized protein n=1 Tax=Phlebiopsis gigantea (strain 11061_1 CR5-6) TaxID=745531 RepID=A0A0C3S557_PHLG1|nr:hypothetical protein PHLGIDRAFT_490114 [Phlebiopsis gigantea 11061_1 CR5-6]
MIWSGQPPPSYYTYSKELIRRGHGFPLWHPDSTGIEPCYGDVGYIERGSFIRIFNLIFDDLNTRGAPKDHKSLGLQNMHVQTIESYIPEGQSVASYHVARTAVEATAAPSTLDRSYGGGELSYKFDCAGKSFALAIIGKGGAKEERFMNRGLLQKCMEEHYESWLEFARETCSMDMRVTDMILVYGTVKASQWAISAYSGRSAQRKMSISATIGASSASFQLNSRDSVEVSAESRYGNTNSTSAEETNNKTHALFIEFMKIAQANFYRFQMQLKASEKDIQAFEPRSGLSKWRLRRSRLKKKYEVERPKDMTSPVK